MNFTKNVMMRSPEGELGMTEKSNHNDDKKVEKSRDLSNEEGEEKKTISEKIHDALQDWSNDDQRDQEFDDTRP